MSMIVDVADAIVASLNTGSFSQAFTAERKYQPVFDLPHLADLKVSVAPRSIVSEVATRQKSSFDCTIDVGIQKKLVAEDTTEIDALLALAEEMLIHLRDTRLEGVAAAWVRVEHSPVVSLEHLDQQRVLTSILSVMYRVWR